MIDNTSTPGPPPRWCWWPCLGCLDRQIRLVAHAQEHARTAWNAAARSLLIGPMAVAAAIRLLVDQRPGPYRCGYVYPGETPNRP